MKYDDNGLKWLHIRNWKKYQPSGKLFKKDARLKYVLDWTDKLDNYDYQQLTITQRWLFESLCLLAGVRPLRSVPNDPIWIGNALHVSREQMHCVPQALAKLLVRGFITANNNEKNFDEEDEKGIGELRVESREGDGEGLLVSQSVSFEGEGQENEKEEFEVLDKEMPVHDLPCFSLLHEEFGRSKILPEEVIRRVHTVLARLGKDQFWMQGCIQYALKHKWWSTRVVSAKTFADCLFNGLDDPDGKKLPAQYDLFVVKRKSAGAGR